MIVLGIGGGLIPSYIKGEDRAVVSIVRTIVAGLVIGAYVQLELPDLPLVSDASAPLLGLLLKLEYREE